MNPKSLLALSSVFLGGALLASGCGGGGGGVETPTATPIVTGTPTTTATAGPTVTPTSGSSTFSDEFNSGRLDTSKWTVLDRSHVIQRTEFGNQPTFIQDGTTGYMRVNMDSYLPDDAARAQGDLQFYGTEVVAKSLIPRGSGIRFESRMRIVNNRGLVGSFFMFGQKGEYGSTTNPLSFDEIDHELVTNFFTDSRSTWTNCYNDFRVPQPGFEGGDSYGDTTKNRGEADPFTTGYDSTTWNVYRIDWKPGQVQWFINDQLIRTETAGIVPDDALGVRFNLWAAKSPFGWDAAYSDTLKPATTASANTRYTMDVDWVRVSPLPTTTTNTVRAATPNLIPLSDQQIQKGVAGATYSRKR